MQDHHRPLVDGQPVQLPLHAVALGHGHGKVVRTYRFRVRHDAQLHEVPLPFLPGEPVAGPDGQSMEPGVPRVRVAESAHVPPSRDERLLDRVLGAVAVAKDERGDGVLTVHRRPRQVGERVAVPGPGPFDELSLHATTDVSRLMWPRSS